MENALNAGEEISFSTPATIGVEVISFAKITEREIAVVRQVVTVNWDAREEALRCPELAIPPTPRPRSIPSSYMQQGY